MITDKSDDLDSTVSCHDWIIRGSHRPNYRSSNTTELKRIFCSDLGTMTTVIFLPTSTQRLNIYENAMYIIKYIIIEDDSLSIIID